MTREYVFRGEGDLAVAARMDALDEQDRGAGPTAPRSSATLTRYRAPTVEASTSRSPATSVASSTAARMR
jgi:hypothetical protein